ncbi:hypothetical protein IJ707_00050 [bacterium]|nr:hypothetical protein [bacterium]
MELENYLIEEKNYIIAIDEISKKINSLLQDNFYHFLKGKGNRKTLEKITALNTAVRLMTYCLKQRRTEYYKVIDENYVDNFTYEEMI